MGTTPLMPLLSDEERIALLRLARASLSHQICNQSPLPQALIDSYGIGETCHCAFNCFVSLHLNHRLRGCIGTVRADSPLLEAIANAAISAGLRDPRFQPIELDELENCEIEISVLSDFVPVFSLDEIVIGKHGLFMDDGIHRGLLLPQVATQFNWSVEEFLQQTMKKAGCINTNITAVSGLNIFEAQIFSEHQLGIDRLQN